VASHAVTHGLVLTLKINPSLFVALQASAFSNFKANMAKAYAINMDPDLPYW
jgi:hypothetical protein